MDNIFSCSLLPNINCKSIVSCERVLFHGIKWIRINFFFFSRRLNVSNISSVLTCIAFIRNTDLRNSRSECMTITSGKLKKVFISRQQENRVSLKNTIWNCGKTFTAKISCMSPALRLKTWKTIDDYFFWLSIYK